MQAHDDAHEKALADLSAQYAAQMQQSMTAALAELERVQAELRVAQEKAVEEAAAARALGEQIRRDAELAAQAYAEQHRQQLENDIREKILLDVAKQLLRAGHLPALIRQWLNLPEVLLNKARLGADFRPKAFENAQVTYEQQGRGGTIWWEYQSTRIRFDWEFGGGDALALIFVPLEANWEKTTGLPLEERLPVLDHLAYSVIRTQGGSRYELDTDVLVIF